MNSETKQCQNCKNEFVIEPDDFSLSPFGERGGLGKLHELFGDHTDKLINELNEVLVT